MTRAQARSIIVDEVERLVAVLDLLDGDPDLELDDDVEHNGAEPFAPLLMGSEV